MSTAEILNLVLTPFADCLTPEAAEKVAGMRADAATQQHFDELADKANEGTLTEDERMEYEKLRATFHVITILQSKARRLIQDRPAS